MKPIILIGLLLITWLANAATPVIKGVVKEKENPNQPIVGANIYWAGTSHGTTSNASGEFEITVHQASGRFPLVVSFVGYETDTLLVSASKNSVTILLEKNIELDEVVVKERQKGQYMSTLNPIQSTKVTVSELQKAACCNLSESFETNASVDVAYTDAVTGAQQIKMLGLSGIYVQTITENIPSIRGMAAPYGLSYVPGPWMESIQIAKGTSSVVNGYEAITGQINVEYKKPYTDEVFHFNLYGNNEMRTEANLNASYKLTDSLSTMILLHGENQSTEIDQNGDQFLDMPRMKQINFINRWHLTSKDGGDKQIGVKILDENRFSGQKGAFEGSNNLYGIGIHTKHYEVLAKNGYILKRPGTSFAMLLSGWYHNQDALYGKTAYNGSQYNGYINLIYQGNFGSDLHTYKTGASFSTDAFNEQLNAQTFTDNELVPGAYFEYNFNLKNKLNVLAGIRSDYSSTHGLFVTPRVHVKWTITDDLTWRASAGKGYRTAIPLAENSFLLASSRKMIIDQDLKQEEAINMGTSINTKIPIGGKHLNLIVDFYRTNFINQVIRDVDSDVHSVHFTNLEGVSYSNAFQAELFYELFQGFTLNAAYRLNDVKQTINYQVRDVPLTSRYKGLLSMSYATRLNKWQFDLTGQFNGGGRMPDPSATNPLWEEKFAPFTVVNGQITKNYKKWSFYAGSENILSFMMHHPIIASNDPWGENFDGSMIWGPVHGRKIYFGLRYTIKEFK